MPVSGLDITFRRVLEDGRSWGDVGPYEEIRGTLRFAIDPESAANVRITDVGLAPRSANGAVEFSSDVSVILPMDRSKGSGRLMLDVVNRGNRVALPNFNSAGRLAIDPGVSVDADISLGNGFLMERGYTVVACGWQGDTPDMPALITMEGPDAVDVQRNPLTGKVYTQLQSVEDTHNFLLSDKGHRAYPAFDMYEAEARLEVRDMPDGVARLVPRSFWRFGRIENDGTYFADPNYICAGAKFEKGRLYQIVYTTIGAPVLGLSFAALRDCVSWFKYGAEGSKPPIDIGYAYAYGRSQTGRYLRTYIYNDFNRDELGREALDGIIANVAGGMRGEFNQRFGQNSKDRNNMLTQLFPFSSSVLTDPETGVTDSLHRRLDERRSPLRVFYTNTSAEYHRGDASLIHTDPDGTVDVDPGEKARVYHFTGTEHGTGTWPPTDTSDSGEGVSRTQNMRSTIDYTPLLRACLENLDRWVAEGVEPPPSRHPRIDDGTAVAPRKLRAVMDAIPRSNYPRRLPIPHRRNYELRTDVEQVTKMPPVVGKAYGSLVPEVNSDGNEVAGITLPEIAQPLAAHTGWNLRHPDIGGAAQPLMFAGGTLPFSSDLESRMSSSDPRPSISERYASKDDYLARVRSAADSLVIERYLLDQDVETCVAQAAKFWDQFA